MNRAGDDLHKESAVREDNENSLTRFDKTFVVLLGLEAIGIIVLALWNYLARPRLEKTFFPMGAALPPLTDILSSPTYVIAAIFTGFILLYLTRVLALKKKIKTLSFIIVCALFILLLEALSIYLSYWKLSSVI
jgi:hypothetical protein